MVGGAFWVAHGYLEMPRGQQVKRCWQYKDLILERHLSSVFSGVEGEHVLYSINSLGSTVE